MFSKTGLLVGRGSTGKVRLTTTGIELLGVVRDESGRMIRRPASYSWQDVEDIGFELERSSLKDRMLAVVERLPVGEDPLDWDHSLFGMVVVRVIAKDRPEQPVVLRVPLTVRWRPDQDWVDLIQADIREAIHNPQARERFA